MKKKIVITGMGAVTPIGSGVEEYWNNLIAGACGIDKIRQFDATDLAVRIAAEVHSFDLQKYMPKKMIHETDAFTQYAYVAAAEALAMAGKKDGERSGENARMSDDPDRSAGIGLPADPDQMGIVMGTAMAGVATTAATQEILTNAVHKNVGPRFVPRILGNIAAAQIAIAHGITGHSVTLSTACASGGDAVSAAAMLLQADEADAVLAVGAESILCPLVIYSLATCVVAIIIGKLVGYSPAVSCAIACTSMIGYPGTEILSNEVCDSLDCDDETRAKALEYIMPKMIVGGFATVTIASVALAGVLAPMIFA